MAGPGAALTAEEHIDLARRLGELAEHLDEPLCWRAAALQYAAADQVRPTSPATDRLRHAMALHRAGEEDAAESLLADLPDRTPREQAVLALFRAARDAPPTADLTSSGSQVPPEPWAQALLTDNPSHARAALLVALDRVDPAAFGFTGELFSPVREARRLAEVLRDGFGFDTVTTLFDDQAALVAVRAALREAVARSAEREALVVFLSGHGGQAPAPEDSGARQSTFVAYDGQLPATDIHALLRRSRAARMTIVTSYAHSGDLASLAAEGGYEAMTACAADAVDLEGTELSPFMAALLPRLRPESKGADVVRAVDAEMAETPQHPQFRLRPDVPVLVDDSAVVSSRSLARVLLGHCVAASDGALDRVVNLALQGRLPSELARAAQLRLFRDGADERAAGCRSSRPRRRSRRAMRPSGWPREGSPGSTSDRRWPRSPRRFLATRPARPLCRTAPERSSTCWSDSLCRSASAPSSSGPPEHPTP